MNEEIRYVTKDKNTDYAPLTIEAEVYKHCRQCAEDLWQKLRNENLVPILISPPNAPETLVSVMHANIMWHAPNGWNLAERKEPPKEISWWEAIKAFFR